MNRFLSSKAASRLFAASCAVLLIGLFTAAAQGPESSPSTAKRRAPRSTPAPPVLAANTSPASGLAPALSSGDAPAVVSESAPPTDAAETPATTQTEILASAGATFASKERIAVFRGDVRVHDPKFQLACDKLTVFLNKGADKNASALTATPAPATPPPLAGAASPAPDAKPASGGGIDHAIATGHVIIIQERAPTATGGETKRSVGRAEEADFDNKSGDMVLKGSPSVEQNGNTHVATSNDTVMTLRRDNSLVTVGPSRTLITQRKGNEMPGTSPAAGGAAAAPSPSASPASTRGRH